MLSSSLTCSMSVPPANVTFHESEFAFPSTAHLHAINEHQTIFAYLSIEDELILSKAYQIHIIRLLEESKHKISAKLASKPNDIKFITINNTSKSMKKSEKLQYALVIGYEGGNMQVMDMECAILFTQHICDTPIRSISLHFDNCFYSYCPSLIINCQSHLLFITADEIYRTISKSLRDTLNWHERSDMDVVIDTLWSPKKIILDSIPSEIVDVVSVPPIDLMKHGIKTSLLDPEPPLNLYTSNQLFLIIVGYQPCITYVQIEKSSKGFGVREIKQGANKLVKSAFNLVTQSISLGGMFSSFWGASTNANTYDDDEEDEDEEDDQELEQSESSKKNDARSAAEESIRNLPGTRYKIQCTLADQNRRIEQIILSPLRKYAALIDSYGRISILDCHTCSIVRMFKGCRGAQCGWIQLDVSSVNVEFESNEDINISLKANSSTSSSSKSTSFSLPWTFKNILLLVIYIRPRGILEIYHISIKHRLGALLFNPNGKLLYHLSLFEQTKNKYADPSHIFLCDFSKKTQSLASSTFSLASFKTATVDDIDLDAFDEEDIKFDGAMYELKLSINRDAIKQQTAQSDQAKNGLLSVPQHLSPAKSTGSSVGRYAPITFIHPMSAKVSPQKQTKKADKRRNINNDDNDENKNNDDKDEDEEEDDEEETEELPPANTLDAANFDATFMKYIENWKSYMADIPNALIQCLQISSEADLTRCWNILLSVPLKHHSEITSFCDFLSHTIHQIVANSFRHSTPSPSESSVLETEPLQSHNQQLRLWLFRDGCITSYSRICSAYLKHYHKEKITLSLSEWSDFWISHYLRPKSQSSIDAQQTVTGDYDGNSHLETFANFLFGVIPLESEHIEENEGAHSINNDKEAANQADRKATLRPYEIPALAMKSMKLPTSVLSLYLELFLYWFVKEKAHKWAWNGPQLEEEENIKDSADKSRWEKMTKQMKIRLSKLYEQEDASLYQGYYWKYLLDFDSLHVWLGSSRVSGFGEITVNWTHERFDNFLSNPLNQIEQKYLPTLQYFVNKGGQLSGFLRDYIQNTTQLSHAFLLCRVADAVYNDRESGKQSKEETDSDSDTAEPVNNEWFVFASRVLKVKVFSYLLDYNHHSNQVSSLSVSQTHYMISLKQILANYYRHGYSLNDMESDLPISRLLAKYIIAEIENNVIPNKQKKHKPTATDSELDGEEKDAAQKQQDMDVVLQKRYAMNEMYIDTLLFMFDVIDFIAKDKTQDYDAIALYVSSQQTQLQLDYFDEEFIQNVLRNIYYIVRIVPAHVNVEWLILYCLFDIYEHIVSGDDIQQQLSLLHKFQTCCTKILQYYGNSNMSVQLEIAILNGQLWYYVLSSLLNTHVLNVQPSELGLQRDIIAHCVEWIKFVSNIIDSLIVIQQQNKHELIDSNAIMDHKEKEKEKDEEKKQSQHDADDSTLSHSPLKSPTLSNQISALKMTSLKLSKHGQQEIVSFLSNKQAKIGQGYQREKKYLYEDKSELASWPPPSTAPSFIYNQYLQPGTLIFFTSRSVIYTTHLKKMLNLYLQILRLYFVAMRAKIAVIAAHDNHHEKVEQKENKRDEAKAMDGKPSSKSKKHSKIYLYDIFPDFAEFDGNLFTFELFQSYTTSKFNGHTLIRYDGLKEVKFKSVMIIAKKWISGALDLASSWNLDAHKVKRYIIIELCNNYKDEIGLELMKDDLEYNHVHNNEDSNHKQLLAQSLLHVVKKRVCFYLNQLLHSPQHQHILAGIPADAFQELLHYNDTFGDTAEEDQEKEKAQRGRNEMHRMNDIIQMSISSKDKKEIKQRPIAVLQRNLKLTLATNSLLQQQDDFYEKHSKQEINTLVQIINLLMHKT